MSRIRRRLAILAIWAITLTAPATASNADSRQMRCPSIAKVVSVSQDTGGNFVLLNLQRGQQLARPIIRYMPGMNGQAIMAVDFSGAVVLSGAQIFQFSDSAIRQVHLGQLVGQLNSSPPVLRMTFVAALASAFKAVDFRSSPGQLVVHLPAAPIQSLPSWVPQPRPSAAPGSENVAPQAALRGPIVIESMPDARYIRLPGSHEGVQPAHSTAQANSSTSHTSGSSLVKTALTALPTAANVHQPLDSDPPLAPARRNSAASKPKVAQLYSTLPPTAPTIIFGPPAPIVLYGPPSPTATGKTQQVASTRVLPEAAPPPLAPSIDRNQPGKPFINIVLTGNSPTSLQLHAGDLPTKTFRLHDPERFVIDIPGIDHRLVRVPDVTDDIAYIRRFRVGSPEGAPDTARVVIDLSTADTAISEKPGANAGDLLVVFGSSIGQPSQPAAAQQPTTPAEPPRPPANCLVVLDAGHGGSDPGAQRGDIQEKELTLEIVEKLKQSLQKHGVRVRLTRSDDTFISLEDRVKITNESRPDAFVSVHINSLETNVSTTGIETYFYNDTSKDLAQLIHTSLVKELAAPDRGVRKARFYVINHTPRPAILAEVGFISNKDERDKLASGEYQLHIAEALADGVMTYLAAHQQPAESGTISALPASSAEQSFTQNLQLKPKANSPIRLKKSGMREGSSRIQHDEKRKTQVARQSLKFKKSHLASTRS
jgi:N-acetylmuramoyl-L-alanine amidase